MSNAVRSLWAESRAPHPPARVWRDWALVALLVPAAVVEGILRADMVWRPVSLIACVTLVFTLLWRRTDPLVVVAVAFGSLAVVDAVAIISGVEWTGLYTTAYVLLLPYSLFRWGAGREAVIGLAIMVVSLSLSVISDFTGVGDSVGGGILLLFPAALGASVRYRVTSRLREMDQVKLREREQLARELHDSIGHHVSAIAIQAQAGQARADSHPGAAVDALEVIEEEASRTLSEMRLMVSALRDREEPEHAPQQGVADIGRLAQSVGDSPRVDLELLGDLDDLRPSMEAAIYRLAQESITNAVRHARHATRITVLVAGDDDCVRLTVSDDGDASPSASSSSPGYGLMGMTERAKLLGGTLEAGPSPDRGWTINAVLPRNGTGT